MKDFVITLQNIRTKHKIWAVKNVHGNYIIQKIRTEGKVWEVQNLLGDYIMEE